MKLIDLLMLMAKDSIPLTAERNGKMRNNIDINCMNDSEMQITLCFMSEPETWISVYPESAILVPWYDCEVTDITPDGNKLDIWLAYENFLVDKGLVTLNEQEATNDE